MAHVKVFYSKEDFERVSEGTALLDIDGISPLFDGVMPKLAAGDGTPIGGRLVDEFDATDKELANFSWMVMPRAKNAVGERAGYYRYEVSL